MNVRMSLKESHLPTQIPKEWRRGQQLVAPHTHGLMGGSETRKTKRMYRTWEESPLWSSAPSQAGLGGWTPLFSGFVSRAHLLSVLVKAFAARLSPAAIPTERGNILWLVALLSSGWNFEHFSRKKWWRDAVLQSSSHSGVACCSLARIPHVPIPSVQVIVNGAFCGIMSHVNQWIWKGSLIALVNKRSHCRSTTVELLEISWDATGWHCCVMGFRAWSVPWRALSLSFTRIELYHTTDSTHEPPP